jgi:hypothetical protein
MLPGDNVFGLQYCLRRRCRGDDDIGALGSACDIRAGSNFNAEALA